MLQPELEAGDTVVEVAELEKFHCFSEVPPDAVARLAQLAVRRRYRKGMVLCFEGEPVDAVHFIVDGRVKLWVTNEDGREQILALLGPGDLFPYTSFVNGDRCAGSAQALQQTVTLAVRPDQLRRLLLEQPLLATAFLSVLAERIHHLEETVRDLSLRTVPGRLARVLINEAYRYGEKVEDGYEFPFRYTQQDLAHLVGATRETVSRTLSAFRREGALRPGRKGRVYADIRLLAQWL
ncbi:MAG TPA: Crp/Fnr family transcriptional regulator [Sphingobacteriaceae bacterium]|nr:Crp/Fnr family transcriptional regulator [Sphingobacteriaceae bacterium]